MSAETLVALVVIVSLNILSGMRVSWYYCVGLLAELWVDNVHFLLF